MSNRFRTFVINLLPFRNGAVLPVLGVVCVLFLTQSIALAAVNSWDEDLEGTLPLPTGYTLSVADPGSGVTSITADTGEGVLHLLDSNTSNKMGRIDRGNWTNVSGVTLHARFRFQSSDATVMGLQLNDGVSDGRVSWKWTGGLLTLSNGTADPGQLSSISAPVNSWMEMWVKISGYRYSVYLFNNGVWSLYSVGSTMATGAGGAVYLGSSSNPGKGEMDFDFWRLETTGGYAPGDANAPAIAPLTSLPVNAATNPIVAGQSTNITVGLSQVGYDYQLRTSPANVNVGTPVHGTGGTINLPTGPLTSATTFNVLAISTTNPTCNAQLAATSTVIAAIPVATIVEAKDYPDNTIISISGKHVAARSALAYWIEESDRTSGIKVNSSSVPEPGSLADVIGKLVTVAGERYLDPISEHIGNLSLAPKPIGMLQPALGGSALNDYTPGVEGAAGPNNIGLLVRIWGKVTAVGDTYYYVDDGSAVKDGTQTNDEPNVGVRILSTAGNNQVNDYVSLTGIVTGFLNSNSEIQRAIVPIVNDCTPPNANLTVGALADSVCPGQSTSITVALSEVGVNYQLRANPGNANVGVAIAGNGGTINLPTDAINTNSTFDVIASNATTGCAALLKATKTISVNAIPTTNNAIAAKPSVVISGQSTNINVSLSQMDVTYQLRNNADNSLIGAPMGGTGSAINLPTGILTANTTFNVLATNASSCSVQLDGTPSVTVEPPGTIHSKVGIHVVCGPRGLPNFSFIQFLKQCSDAGHPVAIVKCVDDMSAATDAKQVDTATLTIGRFNEAKDPNTGDDINLQGMDEYVNQDPTETAIYIYSIMKPMWKAHPQIDVWEIFNEWDSHYSWQADFQIKLMDLAEADGLRIALFSSSVGTPSQSVYPDVARACARAKAHGNHILSLHEYALYGDPTLLSNESPYLVTRYRMLYNYLIQHNADCKLALTEVGQNAGGTFIGKDLFIQDFAWYDTEMKKDSYVIGCTAWLLGDCGWGGASFVEALPELADYISTH